VISLPARKEETTVRKPGISLSSHSNSPYGY